QCAAKGAISPWAKARAAAWNACCSSLKLKSIDHRKVAVRHPPLRMRPPGEGRVAERRAVWTLSSVARRRCAAPVRSFEFVDHRAEQHFVRGQLLGLGQRLRDPGFIDQVAPG